MERRVLVVDAANVVGSVPDGWWRDRAGAAARLHAGLASALAGADLPYDAVLLVLEGAARSGVATGCAGGVRTVHAPGSGDDEIVERCRELTGAGASVTLANADRGLTGRVTGMGVTVVGPRSVRLMRRAQV